LILAPEWGSLKLFLNDHGRLRDATAQWGLDRWVGRWNGVTTGDLDGEGRLGIVATSWGRNTNYRVDATQRLLLYYGDFTVRGRRRRRSPLPPTPEWRTSTATGTRICFSPRTFFPPR